MKIIERTISGEADKRIVLANGRIARTLSFGSTWNSILIGVRWGWRVPLEETITDGHFFLGACAGTTNVFGDATADHAVGAYYDATTLVYSVSGMSAPSGNAHTRGFKRVGTTDTSVSMHVSQTHVYGPANIAGAGGDYGPARRGIFYLSILKGSPNYTLQCVIADTAPYGDFDISLPLFTSTMENTTLVGIVTQLNTVAGGTQYDVSTTSLVPVDEGTDGALDSICLYWNKASSEIELSDIAVARWT